MQTSVVDISIVLAAASHSFLDYVVVLGPYLVIIVVVVFLRAPTKPEGEGGIEVSSHERDGANAKGWKLKGVFRGLTGIMIAKLFVILVLAILAFAHMSNIEKRKTAEDERDSAKKDTVNAETALAGVRDKEVKPLQEELANIENKRIKPLEEALANMETSRIRPLEEAKRRAEEAKSAAEKDLEQVRAQVGEKIAEADAALAKLSETQKMLENARSTATMFVATNLVYALEKGEDYDSYKQGVVWSTADLDFMPEELAARFLDVANKRRPGLQVNTVKAALEVSLEKEGYVNKDVYSLLLREFGH